MSAALQHKPRQRAPDLAAAAMEEIEATRGVFPRIETIETELGMQRADRVGGPRVGDRERDVELR